MSDIAQKQVIRSFAVQCYNEKRLPAISIRTSKGRGSFTKDFLNVCSIILTDFLATKQRLSCYREKICLPLPLNAATERARNE